MKKSRVLSKWFLAVTAAVLSASAGLAQGGRGAGGRDQEDLIDRFLNLATSELNLTVEQRSSLGAILQEVAEQRRELGRGQMELQRDIQAALTDPATEEGTFAALANRRFEIQRQGIALQERQRERVAEVLTARQTLRFILMQERLARRIEAMRREEQQRRRQQ